MRWSDLPLDPPRRTLRQFAGLWLACFGGLSARELLVADRPGVGILLASLAMTIGPLGLVRPRLVRPIFVAWTVLAFPIGWAVSRLALAAAFFGVVTPIGLALRLTGHDPLRLRPEPGRPSYWEPRPATADPARYLRQY